MATALTRFMAKVQQDHATGCWDWTAGPGPTGYGRYQGQQAHRWSWEHFRGPIPAGYQVHHTCENKVCVNPDHLAALSTTDHGATRRKTHCSRGHERIPENLYFTTNGRVCRLCNIERSREQKYRDRTACKNGHPWTPENFKRGKGDRRYCLVCFASRKLKTHCRRGHPMSGDNLAIDSNGSRVCKTCLATRQRAFYLRHLETRQRQTCRRGHLYTPENTITIERGRRCRTCRDERRKRPVRRTHCRNGHPLSGDNLYVAADGQYVCKTCRSSYDHSRHLRQRLTCKRGHAFTAENTGFGSVRRYCRTCREQKRQRNGCGPAE